MKHPVISTFGLAVLSSVSFVTPALAVVNIEYVPIGNANNPTDARVMNDTTTGYGSVAYTYSIAKNEVTIGQYAEFLDAVARIDTYGLYSPSMTTSHINGISQGGVSGSFTYSVAPGSANKPITFVSWFDAARFTNWMHNGQPTGMQSAATTEDGAYTLNGATGGVSISRNVGAKVWIPSENEWYKAAYYDPNKNGAGVGGYWLQATQSDTLAGNTIGVAHSANYNDGDWVGYPGMALTDVGAYGLNSASAYGTNDQGGNVWEWNDAILSVSYRGMRGGRWASTGAISLESVRRGGMDPTGESVGTGFRVASLAAIPEPMSLLSTLVLVSSGLLLRRRAKP